MKTPSLLKLFLLSGIIALGLLSLLFFELDTASRSATERASGLLVDIDTEAKRTETKVKSFLNESEILLNSIESDDVLPLLQTPDSKLVHRLQTEIEKVEGVAEFTFTWDQGQISAQTDSQGKTNVAEKQGPEASRHRTFQTLIRPDLAGELIWSDLHHSQLDQELPAEQRRVVVTVQKAIRHNGELLGVARVGRTVDSLDDLKQLSSTPDWLFLADENGQLLSRLKPNDPLIENPENFRFSLESAPKSVLKALQTLASSKGSEKNHLVSKIEADGKGFVFAFRRIEGSQDWYMGMVWSEDYFLSPLQDARKKMLLVAGLILLATFVLMLGVLKRVYRDLTILTEVAKRMASLDFSPINSTFQIRETEDVSRNLEGANATLRAATKYVPISLVKQLFSQDIEPELGGSIQEISLMFTDVADFTTVSENLSTDELAEKLAEYLAQMSSALSTHNGQILERVGDALLVIWNAPVTIDDHSTKACLAALEAMKQTENNEWDTRFGIHRAEVMVGHFGSTERMNYGVLGDGVNLASRIEGLNKYFGTFILVTQSVVDACRAPLVFRNLDRVAVKGRKEGIEIYELVGFESDVSESKILEIKTYEKALVHFRRQEFNEALALCKSMVEDKAIQRLTKRCEKWLDQSLPESWDSTFRADFK